MIVFSDSKRKKELQDAKLELYDGVKVYSVTENDFEIKRYMGVELKPFKVKRKDGVIEHGTSIIQRYETIAKERKPDFSQHIELPEWWMQREREQLREARTSEPGTKEYKSFWRLRE